MFSSRFLFGKHWQLIESHFPKKYEIMKSSNIPILLLIVSVLSLIACAQKKTNSQTLTAGTEDKTRTTEIPIHLKLPDRGADKLNVSEFADTVLYIPLETNSQSLIKGIYRTQIIGEHILLNCNDKLLLFSKSGKFIRQIGRKGKGPGEYNYVTDFVAVGDTIFISPSSKQTLIKYTINGDFIEELSLPDQFRMTWFDMTHQKKFVSYQGLQSGNLYILDKDLRTIDAITINYNARANPFPTALIDRFDHTMQNGSERRLLFTDYMNDTIWDLSNGRKEVGYVLNLGDKILPEKYRPERFGLEHEQWMKVAVPYQKIKMVETPYFLFIFQKGWTEEDIINTTYIYYIAEKKIAKYETPYIFDDLVGKQNLIPLYSSSDCILATINPFELKEELKKKTDRDSASSSWLEQMSKVKEDDNPILVIIPVRNKTLKN